MGLIVPHRLFVLFTAQELELVICGEPVDIGKLQGTCVYENCRPTDDLIKNLWNVVKEDFTDAER